MKRAPTPLQLEMERLRRAAPKWRCGMCSARAKPHLLWSVTDDTGAIYALPRGWRLDVSGYAVCPDVAWHRRQLRDWEKFKKEIERNRRKKA